MTPDQLRAPLSRRERTHAATVAEIKTSARRLMAAEGTSALNLRAVAREMGMAPSALYRYFDGRDALLTALIVDAFDEVGGRVEDAYAPDDDPVEAFMLVARAFRSWAVGAPQEFGLLYGTPVPGYDAPDDTIGPQLRTSGVLLGLLAHAIDTGQVTIPLADDELPAPLRAAMVQLCQEEKFLSLSPAAAGLAMSCWSTLLGAISADVFGHMPAFGSDAAAALFELTMLRHLRCMGFPVAPHPMGHPPG